MYYDKNETSQQMNAFQNTFSQKEIPKTAPMNQHMLSINNERMNNDFRINGDVSQMDYDSIVLES